MVTNKALLSNAIFALWLPKNDAPEWLFVCSGDATKSDAFQLAQAKKWPVLAVDLLMSYPAALPKGLVQTCSKHQALGLIYNLLYPCSPWYDASDEWLFVCSGDAAQSDVFPTSHLENTKSTQPLGLRPSGWVDLELCPRVWSNPAPNLGL